MYLICRDMHNIYTYEIYVHTYMHIYVSARSLYNPSPPSFPPLFFQTRNTSYTITCLLYSCIHVRINRYMINKNCAIPCAPR